LDGTPSSLAISYTRGLLNQISLPRHRSSGRADWPARPARSTFGSSVPRRRRWPPPCRSPSRLVGCCAAAPPCPGTLAARTDRRHDRPPSRSGRRRPSRRANARSDGGYASQSSPGIPHTSAVAVSGSHRPAAWPRWHPVAESSPGRRCAQTPPHHLQRLVTACAFPPPPPFAPCPPPARQRRWPWLACSAAWLSLTMSIRQPVSLAANRAFCPSLPMASESW
jgi:hypothetical protein